MPSDKPPTKYGVVLFPNFQLLDVAGPLDILNILAKSHSLSLAILSSTLEPVSTLPIIEGDLTSPSFSQSIVPTHTFDSAPDDIEVLLVPGGRGARPEENILPAIDYIRRIYPKLRYLITVCTGSVVVAKAGVLDGRKATSNKMSWQWVSVHDWAASRCMFDCGGYANGQSSQLARSLPGRLNAQGGRLAARSSLGR